MRETTNPDTGDYHQGHSALRVVMLGATGAVGQQVVASLQTTGQLEKLTLLGRRPLTGVANAAIEQHPVDVFDSQSYATLLVGHNVAVCTFGAGQPSVIAKKEFVRVDKDAVIAFATACKRAGVEHFELLASVGANPRSSSIYLRTKGELCDGLIRIGFKRLSIFAPSIILTPQNRYGFAQGLTLKWWPKLDPILIGPWRKYRGVRVETLGAAMAANTQTLGVGVETLYWEDFNALAA
jgi:uncharacterized protein YbjT (DUF2867 family)